MTDNTPGAVKVAPVDIYRAINARVNEAGDLPRDAITSVCRDIAAILGARAMQAAMPALAGVRVKALEWVKHPTADLWRAITSLGTYDLSKIVTPPRWRFAPNDGGDWTEKDGEFTEAQADHDARVVALLSSPDPAIEGAGAREEADEQLQEDEINREIADRVMEWLTTRELLDVGDEVTAAQIIEALDGHERELTRPPQDPHEVLRRLTHTPAGAGDLVERARVVAFCLRSDEQCAEGPEFFDDMASRIEALEAEVERIRGVWDLTRKQLAEVASVSKAWMACATTAEADLAALRAEVERKDVALYQLANIGAGSTWYTAPSVVRKAEDIARAVLAPAKAGG